MLVQPSHPPEQLDGLVVRGEVRVDRGARAELGEPEDRRSGVALLEQRDELVPQPGRREVADEPHLDRSARQALGVVVHPEPVPALVADRAEDPGRVVDEREVVEDADRLRLQVAPPAERVDQPPEVLALQGHGHRVDREVAAEEVLADRRVLDARERGRRVVELRPRRDDVDSLVLAVEDDRGAELPVRPHPPVERIGEAPRELDRVALDRDVDVEVRLAEQDVPHRPADEIDAVVGLADRGDRLEGALEVLEPRELGGQARLDLGLGRRLLPERAQDVAARDDAHEPARPRAPRRGRPSIRREPPAPRRAAPQPRRTRLASS